MFQHPYKDIPELHALQTGQELVRIPDRLGVPFTRRVRALVDCADFQRLRQISQLGLINLVYPGATHTRFEHSLGVFYNACRYLWQLGFNPDFAQLVSPHHAELLLVTALLHDVGHWPYCHPLEDLQLPNIPTHEERAARYLSQPGELQQILRSEWHVDHHEILEILSGTKTQPPWPLLRSILSGPIDIDKLDYLERDSWHCGVPYGRHFDRDRLIQSLTINSTGDGLAITTKGKTAAEMMIFSRYVMYSEVYWHHAVRAATAMLCLGFFKVHHTAHLTTLWDLNEHEFINELCRLSQTDSSHLLFRQLFEQRQLYKRCTDWHPHHRPELYHRLCTSNYQYLYSVMESLTEHLKVDLKIQRRNPLPMILIDLPSLSREVDNQIDVYNRKTGKYLPLRDVSPMVEALAQTQFEQIVKHIRFFVCPGFNRELELDYLLDLIDNI